MLRKSVRRSNEKMSCLLNTHLIYYVTTFVNPTPHLFPQRRVSNPSDGYELKNFILTFHPLGLKIALDKIQGAAYAARKEVES